MPCIRFSRPFAFCLPMLAVAWTILIIAAPAAARDMMRLCEDAIDSHCSAVSIGRGRIAACLYAHADKLTESCRREVERLSRGTLALADTELAGTKSEADLRSLCAADAARLCSTVTIGNGRTLACLYSRSDILSSDCSAAVREALKQLQ